MKLSELILEASYQLQRSKGSDEGTFKINDVDYVAEFKKRGWQTLLSFYKQQDRDMPWAFKQTGDSTNSTAIFKTIVAIAREYLTKVKPRALAFTADEPKRLPLYKKLGLKMLSPGYKLYLHKGVHVVLIRDDFEIPEWFQHEELK